MKLSLTVLVLFLVTSTTAFADRGWHGERSELGRHIENNSAFRHDGNFAHRGYERWRGPFRGSPNRDRDRGMFGGFNHHQSTEQFSAPEIREGIRNGRLSRNEVRELEERRRDLEQERQMYMSDGWLSPRERNDLERDYATYRKRLSHELNDGERGWGRRGW